MAGICLTCLSTQNLNKMREKEWRVFDVLLHPISKKYKSSLRSNPQAKICASCLNCMHQVEVFRRNSLKNFVLLMNKWNKRKSSTNDSLSIHTDADDDGGDGNDPLNDEIYEPYTKTEIQTKCEITPSISPANSSSEADLHDILKEESHSDEELGKDPEVLFIVDPIENSSDSAPNKTKEADEIAEDIAEKQVDCGDESGLSHATKSKRKPRSLKGQKSSTPKRRKKMMEEEKQDQECSCEICNKSFKTSRELANHGNKFHGRSSPVNCELCNKTCTNGYSLYRHHRYVHLKIKPKSELEEQYCDVCDKHYKHAQSFKKHFKQLSHITAEILKKERLKCK